LVDDKKLVIETIKNTGLLNESQIEKALKTQSKNKQRLSTVLAQLGYIANEDTGISLPSQLGLVPTSLEDKEISDEAVKKVSSKFVHRHRIIPLELKDNILAIATDDPLNFLATENLEEILGVKLEIILTAEDDLILLQTKHYGEKKDEKKALDKIVDKIEISRGVSEDERERTEIAGGDEDSAPIIRLVTLVLTEAVKKRASDIHLEPLEKKFRVRYRIDGVLHEIPGPPKHLQGPIISRLKLMAGLDIAEKRLPQDGRIRLKLMDKDLDLRVSSLPGIYGESIVMRILDKSSLLMGLEELGLLLEDRKSFERLINMPNGTLLVTGPTGSGKTTTLYAALNSVNQPNKKIITIEDPVEYQIKGINQVQVKPQVGLVFATGLRSMLRQAPDIIMVGEIRDKETASIAIQAALTGHLIFSTLHTNDAPGAITRLIDMGIKPYLVASTIQAVLAQRLVRRICDKCKEAYKPTPEELKAIDLNEKDLAGATLQKGKGCPECNDTGYKGRIGIFELLIMSDKLREMVFETRSSAELKKKAIELDMKTLREDGKRKILKGITTIPEVVRVAQIEEAI
jgi:type IV pilus assembly protein PilB